MTWEAWPESPVASSPRAAWPWAPLHFHMGAGKERSARYPGALAPPAAPRRVGCGPQLGSWVLVSTQAPLLCPQGGQHSQRSHDHTSLPLMLNSGQKGLGRQTGSPGTCSESPTLYPMCCISHGGAGGWDLVSQVQGFSAHIVRFREPLIGEPGPDPVSSSRPLHTLPALLSPAGASLSPSVTSGPFTITRYTHEAAADLATPCLT